MAYSPNLPDAFDKARNRNSFTPTDSSLFSFFDVTPRPNSFREQTHPLANEAARGSLHRRFTTNTVPLLHNVLSPIGQPRRQAMEASAGPEYSLAANQRVQLYEKKRAEYEELRRKRLEFQNEMDLIDRQANQHEDDLLRLSRDLTQYKTLAGHQSEPGTPPELRNENGLARLSRSNRFSTSQLISPSGLSSRSRAGSQVTSAPVERARAYQALTGGPLPPSLPSSKQQSDEEEDSYEDEVLNFNHRAAANLNRNSMPATTRDMASRGGLVDPSILDTVNTSTFLFGDSFEKPSKRESTSSTPRAHSGFLQMNETVDRFPILVRRDGDSSEDPIITQTPDSDTASHGWPSTYQRSMASQARLSMPSKSTGNSPPNGFPTASSNSNSSGYGTPIIAANNERHSMGPRINAFGQNKRSSLIGNGGNGSVGVIGAPKLTQSYSTNDIPTIKNTGQNGSLARMQGATNTASEQRFLDHNANLGRIPASAMSTNNSNRASKDISSMEFKSQDVRVSMAQPQSGLHASAAPFGPSMSLSGASYGNQPYYGGYGMQAGVQNGLQTLNTAMGNLQLNSQDAFNPQPVYNGYTANVGIGGAQKFRDSQARVIQQRRNQSGEETSRFTHIPLDSLSGEVYGLCKDQHGCRYLQKKLEERKPEHVQFIFDETKNHIVELMTDPFGNYLCQKLLEHSTDEQRTVLMTNAGESMVKIAMNQHGTRALQKMIEFVTTDEQKQIVIYALGAQVVPMIQDLNGNHVIQKCLNRLSSQDSQFIFDAVAMNCVVVGTHRHGCCVIQRCIDHASGNQRAQLVAAITGCSFPLVQDPFGNYVLQYIFDLGEEAFSQPLCRTFLGSISQLSKQKFSSNVMEKCIRIADSETRGAMISEIIECADFDRLVDDPFANYVVQTAWEYADEANEALLAEKIRPVLPRMRHKPYGRRFASKLQERDKKLGVVNNQVSESFSPGPAAFNSMAPPPSYNSHRQSQDFSNPMFQGMATHNHNGAAFNSNNGNDNYGNAHQRRYSNAANMASYNGYQTTGYQGYQPSSRLSMHGMPNY